MRKKYDKMNAKNEVQCIWQEPENVCADLKRQEGTRGVRVLPSGRGIAYGNVANKRRKIRTCCGQKGVRLSEAVYGPARYRKGIGPGVVLWLEGCMLYRRPGVRCRRPPLRRRPAFRRRRSWSAGGWMTGRQYPLRRRRVRPRCGGRSRGIGLATRFAVLPENVSAS